MKTEELWFDVGIKRYTTYYSTANIATALWFDVGIKRYTTQKKIVQDHTPLWFDVGIKRYTTECTKTTIHCSCGLM